MRVFVLIFLLTASPANAMERSWWKCMVNLLHQNDFDTVFPRAWASEVPEWLKEPWRQAINEGDADAIEVISQLREAPSNRVRFFFSDLKRLGEGSGEPALKVLEPLASIRVIGQIAKRDKVGIENVLTHLLYERATFQLSAKKYGTNFTRDLAAYSGHNRKLHEITLAEVTQPSAVAGYLDSFIQSERFRERSWWVSSAQEEMTAIDSKTTRSITKKLYSVKRLASAKDTGRFRGDYRRRVFWLKSSDEIPPTPDLDRVRIALNEKMDGTPLSIEVLARDRDGSWQPFFYEREGNAWIPQRTIDGVPTEKVCLECHHSVSGAISPRPIFLKTESDFIGVGYRDRALIQELLKY